MTTNKNNSINIMFCGNDKVFDGMLIVLLSIIKYCNKPLNVYILTMDLTEIEDRFKPINEAQCNILDKILKKKNPKSITHLKDMTSIFKNEMYSNNLNIDTHYTPYIFLRLLSDKVEEIPDKILYLDSDLVFYGDVSELYSMNVSSYEIAMAKDYYGKFFINPKYMNSGVVLMNMKSIKEQKCLENARNMCNTKKMLLPDQSALNKCCKHKLLLPNKYNEQNKRHKDTLIRHYSMKIKFFTRPHLLNIKPWEIERIHSIYKIYDYDDIYEEYKNIKNDNKEIMPESQKYEAKQKTHMLKILKEKIFKKNT